MLARHCSRQARSLVLGPAKAAWGGPEGATARALGTAAGSGGSRDTAEVLHNSMSDGFYDVKGRAVAAQERTQPAAQAQRPMNIKQALSSLSEPMPSFLHDSMSEGLYAYHPRPRIVPSRSANSLSDPLPGWLQNSLSDAHYELPQSLRVAAPNPKPRQGFSTARAGAGTTQQRIVVVSRASVSDPEPLHDSFAHGDYTPRKR